MIKSLDLPRELIYMGKGENGYEKYMADDPTGINHVLDELYGVGSNVLFISIFPLAHTNEFTR